MSSAAGAASGAGSQAAASSPPLSQRLRSSLLTLNLFEQARIQSDDLTVHVGRLQTRAFIVLMPLGLLVFLLMLIAQGRLITVTVRPSSYEHYRLLAASHADMLCTCSNDSGSLENILPPLALAKKPVRRLLSANWSAEGELMPRQRKDEYNEGWRFTTGDITHDWTAVGFRTYDNWCVNKRYISMPDRADRWDDPHGVWEDKDDESRNNFWRDKCEFNECCRNKAPSTTDLNLRPFDDGMALYSLLGLTADYGKADSQDFLAQWCVIVMDQRASAIEQFWRTPLSAPTLLSQSLLLRTNKDLALQSTLRGMLKMQHVSCFGNPSKFCQPIEAPGNWTTEERHDYPIAPLPTLAHQFLQPFLDCNMSLPLQGLQTANPLPAGYETSGVSYPFSSFKHHFPSLIPYAFIESWTPDDARAHREHYGVCSPDQCRYQDLMVTDVVTLLSIMLGVVSGWSGGLRIALGLVGTWWIGRQQNNGKANGAHADGDGRADRSKKDDEEGSDSPTPRRTRVESKEHRDQSFSPSVDSSSPLFSPNSPDDVFVHVLVHGTGAEPSPSSSSASAAAATGVKQRRVPHADHQSTASAAVAHAAAISDSEIDDEEAPLVPRSS